MEIIVNKIKLEEIKAFRDLFLQENNFQFVHDKCHYYGWADDYSFIVDGNKIGYGSVWGKDKREDRDTIFEFYLLRPFRKLASVIFKEFISASQVKFIECQTNYPLQASMLHEHAVNIFAEKILFEDHFTTQFGISNIIFRKKNENDNISEDDGDYVIEQNKKIVATGGFVTNYNFPFIDMYYDVKEGFIKKGLGTLMVQELKREAYSMNKIPSARCNVDNIASKLTLLKAGMKICGHMLIGEIKP